MFWCRKKNRYQLVRNGIAYDKWNCLAFESIKRGFHGVIPSDQQKRLQQRVQEFVTVAIENSFGHVNRTRVRRIPWSGDGVTCINTCSYISVVLLYLTRCILVVLHMHASRVSHTWSSNPKGQGSALRLLWNRTKIVGCCGIGAIYIYIHIYEHIRYSLLVGKFTHAAHTHGPSFSLTLEGSLHVLR